MTCCDARADGLRLVIGRAGSFQAVIYASPRVLCGLQCASIEDRNHFEALVPRIYELGGALPRDMKDFHDISGCPPAYLPKDLSDVRKILQVLVEAERCAVRAYTHICNLTAGKDHRTYDLALSILHEEIEHESWFSEFLGEGPSGHFLRRGETSPFVSKFLK